ncbi:MAG TPA: dihydrofolate reductase family protein [Candidatus Krumholzibacteria bacterium]|nr:dihydrofolate reductase family protein [Candidatus Krumholzibacteria bacterium]
MRRLIVSTFLSLDGVLQAPGGPAEDPTGGFAHGGWMFPYADETMDIGEAGFDGRDRELLLGRRTYQIFAAYWPYQPADNPVAAIFNATRKHVASRTLTSLGWANATLLEGEVAAAVRALKASPGPDLQVIGSGGLVATLQAAALVDEYNLWIFPVVLGAGKRLFTGSARAEGLRLVRSKVSGSGVVMATYVPDGAVRSGTFETVAPSDDELARRRMMAEGQW